jgi:hypothetical protein
MAGVAVYLHSFLTSLLKTVVNGQLQGPTHVLQGKAPPVRTELEFGWAPELVWRLRTKSVTLAPDRIPAGARELLSESPSR